MRKLYIHTAKLAMRDACAARRKRFWGFVNRIEHARWAGLGSLLGGSETKEEP